MSVPATTRLENVYDVLSKTYAAFGEADDEWPADRLGDTPFKSLVSVSLSTMTTSKRTVAAATALYRKVSTPRELLELGDDELAALIKPVAYYNQKAKSLKKMAWQLLERHGGEVPHTKKELMDLPGVGRKVADILMNFNFGEPTVAVDTHVHRVLNRLGVLHTKTHTKTADEIDELTPEKYKQHAHELLIQHGMKVCKARTPSCGECPLTRLCDYYQGTAAAS